MNSALRADHLRKDFGSVNAVRDISFSIERGSTFGLLGPNGAGKTTVMRMIMGIYTPDGGTISWENEKVNARMRRRFGYLPEERGLYGRMKVSDQIAYFGRLHNIPENLVESKVKGWIERLGLQAHAERPCAELSKGNQQKVQIACAAVHDPELLVLDEPFSGLDPVNADALLHILTELRKQGTTLVLSSHQMWQLEYLCDSFCIISHGENRAFGTLAQLRATQPQRTLYVEPATDAVRKALAALPATILPSENGTVRAEISVSKDLAAVLRSLVAVEAITRFEAAGPSLHDIYVKATEKA